MAVATGRSELPPVPVPVAGQAVTREAQVGVLKNLAPCQQWLGIGDIPAAMAITTGNTAMFPLQDVAGLRVSERIPSVRPVNQREVLAVMLDVANRTILLIRPGVEPLAGVDAFRQQDMAIQAFPSRKLLAELVTARAVLQPFQVRV